MRVRVHVSSCYRVLVLVLLFVVSFACILNHAVRSFEDDQGLYESL
jgi:hypothetical protein